MTKFICETKNLSKKYKDFYALKNVNLTIPKGEIYGLVGENGAGKTTLIRLLTGLNFKSEGEIILFGHKDNLQHERSKIGCTIEMPALYKDMTASQNLEVQRIQRGIPNKKCITDTLELIGLSNAGKKRVASHDLRTPLTSIQGYLTLLQECEDKQEQGQCIKIIKAKTDYLTDLVQEFYDLSVIENEQVDVECERVDINRIVTDCLIEKYYEFGEIQPTIQTENTPVWIYGNNLICKRIIENLIVNALRYSDNYIEVSINQKGVFTIKNSTKSLDDIDVNLLFNKFYTVDKSRTKGSSGLGLYIVKELLKKIDGKIENVSYEKNILSISICFPLYNDKKLRAYETFSVK